MKRHPFLIILHVDFMPFVLFVDLSVSVMLIMTFDLHLIPCN